MATTSSIESVSGPGGVEVPAEGSGSASSRGLVQEIVGAGLLDSLFDRVDAGELRLLGGAGGVG